MKNKMLLVLIIAVGYTLPALAQNNTIPAKPNITVPVAAPHIQKVFSVTLTLDSVTTAGTGKTKYITAVFKSIGTGTITYTLTDNSSSANGTNSYTFPPETLTLSGTGTDVIHFAKGFYIRSSHGYFITTIAPNQVESNHI
ncbi:hypothetical protein [Ferruginibacter sp.]